LPVTNALIGIDVTPVEQGQYTFIVSLMHVNLNTFNRVDNHICTAALVTRNHVLSAAHCIEDRLKNETVVLAGSNYLSLCTAYEIFAWITYNEWGERRRIFIEFDTNDISIIKVINLNHFL
jgi:hypothetical protein